MNLSLAAANRVYTCGESCDLRRHRIDQEKLAVFSQALRLLQGSVGDEAGDDYWKPFFRQARRCLFESCSAPIPLSHPHAFGAASLEALCKQVRNCHHVYPQFESQTAELLTCAEKLSTVSENPLLDELIRIRKEFADVAIAVVLKEPRAIPLTEEIINGCELMAKAEVIGISQLRGGVHYDVLAIFGPTRWYPDHVFTAPRARYIHIIHFSAIRDRWLPGSVFAMTQNGMAEDSRLHGRLPREIQNEDATEVPHDGIDAMDVLPVIDWGWARTQYGASSRDGDPQSYDNVQARLFQLESDQYMFIGSEEGDTALVIDPEGEGGSQVRRIGADKIRPGMFLLARTGNREGYGDYIADVADEILGSTAERLRRIQKAWKRRLRNEVSRCDLTSVSIRILELKSNRANESNVRNWISPRTIKTQYIEDFSAILQLIGMGDKADKFWRAMTLIDRAHKRAGHLIRKRLMQEIRGSAFDDLMRLGRKEFSLGQDGVTTITALRVAEVCSELIEVPVSRIGRLLFADHLLWRA